MNLKDIIGETTDYDKKLTLEVKRPKSWCKSVSAFANGIGGTLIFGVSNDNEVRGLLDAEKDAEIRHALTRFRNFILVFLERKIIKH